MKYEFMLMFKIYKSLKWCVSAFTILVGLSLPVSHGFAQSTAALDNGVTENPFEFHDLDTNLTFEIPTDKSSSGTPVTSVEALEYAAKNGDEIAMWRLGRHYSSNEQVKNNHLRAFEMFKNVVRSQVDLTPYSPKAPFTANALVSLGGYYRNGIPHSRVAQNRQQAWSMYLTAATVYGNPHAQFALFEMCDSDLGENCSNIQAGRWLKRSAINGHVAGQAHFGLRLFEGGRDMLRNKTEGLKWLTIARERAHGINQRWVYQMHENVFSVSSAKERESARLLAEDWMRRKCDNIQTC